MSTTQWRWTAAKSRKKPNTEKTEVASTDAHLIDSDFRYSLHWWVFVTWIQTRIINEEKPLLFSQTTFTVASHRVLRSSNRWSADYAPSVSSPHTARLYWYPLSNYRVLTFPDRKWTREHIAGWSRVSLPRNIRRSTLCLPSIKYDSLIVCIVKLSYSINYSYILNIWPPKWVLTDYIFLEFDCYEFNLIDLIRISCLHCRLNGNVGTHKHITVKLY